MKKQCKEEYLILKDIFRRYKLQEKEMRYIWKIIKPIYLHEEFQKRMKDPFFHHHDITLGEHILGDTILAYKSCQRKELSEVITKRTILISMFHDLYVLPWMNTSSKKYFINYHAFTHPIEAIVNAITWFPKYFEDLEDSKVIIDGVLHHMYPCPVRTINSIELELNNQQLYENLEDKYKRIIDKSLKNDILKNMSLRNSFYIEGRIVSKVDKIITIKKDLKGKKVLQMLKVTFLACKTAITRN